MQSRCISEGFNLRNRYNSFISIYTRNWFKNKKWGVYIYGTDEQRRGQLMFLKKERSNKIKIKKILKVKDGTDWR